MQGAGKVSCVRPRLAVPREAPSKGALGGIWEDIACSWLLCGTGLSVLSSATRPGLRVCAEPGSLTLHCSVLAQNCWSCSSPRLEPHGAVPKPLPARSVPGAGAHGVPPETRGPHGQGQTGRKREHSCCVLLPSSLHGTGRHCWAALRSPCHHPRLGHLPALSGPPGVPWLRAVLGLHPSAH